MKKSCTPTSTEHPSVVILTEDDCLGDIPEDMQEVTMLEERDQAAGNAECLGISSSKLNIK